MYGRALLCLVVSYCVVVPAAFGADRIVIDSETTQTLEDELYLQYSAGDANGGVVENSGTAVFVPGTIFRLNSAASGGVIWNQGQIQLGDGSDTLSFFQNQSTGDGGAIYNADTGTIGALGRVLFQNNTGANGGAIDNHGTAESIERASFILNSAGTGQGGAIRNKGHFGGITDVLFNANTSGAGGAINNQAVIENITGTTFSSNSVLVGEDAQQGGAILNSGTIGLVATSEFSGNQAGTNGGAIANVAVDADDAPSVTLQNVRFLSNVAGEHGGAIYNGDAGTVTLQGDNVFSGNTAGGARNDIYNDGQIVIADGVTRIGSGIDGNGTLVVNSAGTLNIGATTVTQGRIELNGDVSMMVVNGDSYGRLLAQQYVPGADGVVHVSVGTAGTYDLFQSDVGINIEYNDSIYEMTRDGGDVTFALRPVDEIARDNNLGTDAAMILARMASVGEYSIAVASLNAQQALADGDTEYVQGESGKLGAVTEPVAQVVATAVQSQILNVAGGRMANMAHGRSGGDDDSGGYGAWGRVLFNKSKYSDAFDGNMRGITIGADMQMENGLTLGAGYAYVRADTYSDAHDTDITNNVFFAYGQYQPAQWFVNAVVSYNAMGYADTTNAFGVLFETEHDAAAVGAQVMSGYDFKSGITPMAGVRYLYISQDQYSNGLVHLGGDDANYMTGVAGLRYAFNIGADWAVHIRPELQAAVTYDFLSDAGMASVMVPGIASYAVDVMTMARLGGEFGIGLGVQYDGWDISVEYDMQLREDFMSHTGMLTFRYDF